MSADERGVTLRLDLPAFALGAPGADGRATLELTGWKVYADPGRPLLPFAQAILAIPQGASARATLVSSGPVATREHVRLAIAGKPVMRDAKDGLGPQPGLEPATPIADGPWPAGIVTVSAPFELRRQRMVAVSLNPFRYDEAAARLTSAGALVVRVDFVGGAAGGAAAGPADKYFEPLYRELLLNASQAPAFRAPERLHVARAITEPGGRLSRAALPAAIAARASFDETEPEVRVRIDSTGVWGLDYDALVANGYPSGVPVAEVSVHRHEYVPDASPSYVTLELPIEVQDANGNGVFDSGDRIVVWVQNWAERSRASIAQRDWGDAEVVYATRLRGGVGLRVPQRPAMPRAPQAPLASYPWTERTEKNLSYVEANFDTTWFDRFVWTFSYLPYLGRSDSIAFAVDDLDAAQPAEFRIRWEGITYTPHFVWGTVTKNARTGSAVSTYVADSLVWTGFAPFVSDAAIPGSALSEGLTNRLAIWGRSGEGPPGQFDFTNASIDWYELTYWRQFRALGGYLACNNAGAAGTYQIHAGGFGSNALEAWDVSDSTAPVRLAAPQIALGADWTADFQDSAGAGQLRRYVVFDTPKSPPASAYGAVTRRQLSTAFANHDYLLIVPEALLPAVTPLVNLRTSQGFDVQVAPLESVNDEFNGGRKSKWSIKRLVRFAYLNWNAKFLLLVGDGSQDTHGTLATSGPDLVPIAPINSNVQDELIAGDPWYAWCFDDDPSCALDPVPLPQMYVGRLPASTLPEATNEVLKIVNYDAVAPDQLWRRHILLNSDDAYSGSLQGDVGGHLDYCFQSQELFFHSLTGQVRDVILNQAGLRQCQADTVDLRSYITTPSLYYQSGTDTCRTSAVAAENVVRSTLTPQLLSWLSGGLLWWNYQGHANQRVLAHERFFTNGDGEPFDYLNIVNDGKPFLMSAFSCHVNDFASYIERDPQTGRCIGENLMNAPNRCAVAVWASTGFELVPTSPTYQLNVEQARAMFADPPRDPDIGDHGARVVLGEALALAVARYVPTRGGSYFEKFVGLTYNLLGDPATRFTVGPPQIFVTANGDTVTDNQPVRLTTTGDALDLEADFVSNVSLSAISVDRVDETGAHTVPDSEFTLTPAFPDTVTGGRHYHMSYHTTLGTGAQKFILHSTDRYGTTSTFNVVFELQTVLLHDNLPVANGDVLPADVSSSSAHTLTLLLISPTTLDPPTDLALQVDSLPQAFTATPARGDTSGRVWMLAWTHAPYTNGAHTVTLALQGTVVAVHRFQVGSTLRISNLVTFPNPFDQDGMRFAFYLEGDASGEVMVRVFTSAGKLVWSHTQPALPGHYQEIPWDGRDAEGTQIANGVYFYKLLVHAGGSDVTRQGPIVKLRRARHVADTVPAGP
ncbi:MAG TPA: C25 family cysteine peptidase [Candidatus Eisenbacteria bacterium]|nr:C25 family cysteine peptidase [Candidatus Eisenbacteria bacterium]